LIGEFIAGEAVADPRPWSWQNGCPYARICGPIGPICPYIHFHLRFRCLGTGVHLGHIAWAGPLYVA
jgi:hypothetical protein